MLEKDPEIKIAKIFSFIISVMYVIIFIPGGIYQWFHYSFLSSVILSSGVVIILSTFGLLLNPKRYLIFGLLIMIFSILTFCAFASIPFSGHFFGMIILGLFMILGVSVGFLTILHDKKS